MAVDEPGAVTPILRPFRSAIDLISPAFSVFTAITMAGKRPSSQTAWISWPFACMRIVCS
jgi:hypothetical protein